MGHAIERKHERAPDAALCGEHLSAGGGEPIVAATALACAFHPAAVDQAEAFEAIESGVEGGDVEGDGAIGSVVDQPADVVPVAVLLLEQGQHEDFRAATLQFTGEVLRHMWPHHILTGRTSKRLARAHTAQALACDGPNLLTSGKRTEPRSGCAA